MIRLFIFYLILIVVSGNRPKDDQCVYLPLAKGNYWNYIDIYSEDKTVEKTYRKITTDTVINDTLYFKMATPMLDSGEHVSYYRCDGQTIYQRKSVATREFIVIPASDSIGYSVISTHDSVSVRITVLNNKARLKTPRSRYRRLLCLQYEDIKTKKTVLVYFKRNVGLVAVCDKKGNIEKYLVDYTLK